MQINKIMKKTLNFAEPKIGKMPQKKSRPSPCNASKNYTVTYILSTNVIWMVCFRQTYKKKKLI